MNILTNVLNQFGANLTNLLAVALAGLIAKGLSLIIINGHKYLLKRKISKYVLKFIPQGIAYGDMLKGIKPNRERLVQAVLTVQNRVLKMFPEKQRPTIDRLIDENAIAREIERKLNEDKQEGLAKPTMEK
ncbi:hypothetical protein JMUB3933_1845 [Leptotrichia wadei]|jgi:hypothetical protein|uniref:Uncharacterized protein n=1 Tax=Leptotrichia wadei TaxID=157687 RepID=A0A510K9M1_9FUSO|nr:hypothetical protein [Leptotrichia wadei]BBM48329.1 hypothetical protein JMUB3933_1845 [Leptotrichia wadei]BBM54089.1 hypothetical protein JMUB3936_0367 [Leptotrichia wadei]